MPETAWISPNFPPCLHQLELKEMTEKLLTGFDSEIPTLTYEDRRIVLTHRGGCSEIQASGLNISALLTARS